MAMLQQSRQDAQGQENSQLWRDLPDGAWACNVIIVSAPTSTNPNAERRKLLHKIDAESRAGLVMMVSFTDATGDGRRFDEGTLHPILGGIPAE